MFTSLSAFGYRMLSLSRCSIALALLFALPSVGRAEVESDQILSMQASEQTVRDNATRAMIASIQLGDSESVYALYQTSLDHRSPEVRTRCKIALEQILLRDKEPGFVGVKMRTQRVEVGEDDPLWVLEVMDVVKGSPADRAGLKPNDLIYAVNDHVISTSESEFFAVLQGRMGQGEVQVDNGDKDPTTKFSSIVQSFSPGDEIELSISRAREEVKTIALTLGDIPAEAKTRLQGEPLKMLDAQDLELGEEDEVEETNIVIYKTLSDRLYLTRSFEQLHEKYLSEKTTATK